MVGLSRLAREGTREVLWPFYKTEDGMHTHVKLWSDGEHIYWGPVGYFTTGKISYVDWTLKSSVWCELGASERIAILSGVAS